MLKPAITNQPIKPPETEMNANDDHQDSTYVHKTFIPSMNHHIEDDLLFLQTTLNKDIDLNKGSTHNMDIKESNWNLDDQIYQNSSDSASASTIPTVQDVIDSDDIEQIAVPQDDHPDKATIYVPNLPRETNKEGLKTVFDVFGTIRKIQLRTQRRSKNKNAVIIFSNDHNARSAMLSLNGTTYRHKKYNIRMSKNKSFMAFKNHPDVPPINPLGHIAQNNHSGQLETKKDPPSAIKKS